MTTYFDNYDDIQRLQYRKELPRYWQTHPDGPRVKPGGRSSLRLPDITDPSREFCVWATFKVYVGKSGGPYRALLPGDFIVGRVSRKDWSVVLWLRYAKGRKWRPVTVPLHVLWNNPIDLSRDENPYLATPGEIHAYVKSCIIARILPETTLAVREIAAGYADASALDLSPEDFAEFESRVSGLNMLLEGRA